MLKGAPSVSGATSYAELCIAAMNEERRLAELKGTDLVKMHIATGNAEPWKQVLRHMPFAVCQEVSSQLKAMQEANVIKPSSSPGQAPLLWYRSMMEPIDSAWIIAKCSN